MPLLGLKDDVREAVHRICRNPRTSLFAAGTLALGIGAATAVFTMAHTALLAPPPYRDGERLVNVYGFREERRHQGVSGPDLADYLAEPGLFDAATLSSYSEYSWTGQSLPGFDGADVLRGLRVTADYFRVLDQPMAAGRGFAPSEDEPGREKVAVINHALWQQRFAGRPQVVGETLTLNGEVHTIVGVAGQGFLTYYPYEVKLWAPLAADTWPRDSRGFRCFARLADGVSLAQAQRRLNAIDKRLEEAYPGTNKEYRAQLEPLLDEFHRLARPAVLGLVGFVLCLLLISAANVASLLLARATRQARELSIRTALGADRLRLYRMMLAESSLLALLASVGGAILAAWLLAGARALLPVMLQYSWVFAISGRVFAAALLVAAVTGLLAGIAPAFESFRLAAGGLRPSFRSQRLLRAIVTAEVALAVVLFVGAGLLGKSFVELLNRPLGYDTEQLLGMRIRLRGERYEGHDRKAAYWAELVERVGALPGVARAASVSDLPMGWQYIGSSFEVAGQEVGPEEERPRAHHLTASPGYFSTVGIPLVAGSGFTASDGPESEPVVIVNDLLAETFWPGQSAIGQQIKLGGKWQKIVGVVRRIRHAGPHDSYENETYRPNRQVNRSTMFLVLRTRVPPESLVTAVRDVLHSLDPNVPAFEIRSMQASLARETAMPRMPMVFATVFAGVAGLLASLGLLGVIAYWVTQRARELGIRSALGAQQHALRALVLRQGVRISLLGLAIGLAVSLAVMRFLRSQLYGMSELDPWVYLSAAALVLVTTLLACWIPAAQAARTDPAGVLREE